MAFCPNCGSKTDDGSKFCANCGATLSTASEPAYSEPAYEQAQYANPAQPSPKQYADNLIEGNFGKGIAAVIMAWFPITSIIAMIFGIKILNAWKEASALAQQYGFRLCGKQIPVRIFGLVSKIGGIVMTAFWALYIIIMIAALA